MFRLSGTGTIGDTVRIYFEKLSRDDIERDNLEALQDLIDWAIEFADIAQVIGRDAPSVIT